MPEVNAGLGNLTELKAFILPASLRAATDYDAQLLQIGLGVAGALASICNREWGYQAGVTEFPANRSFILATRYPINSTIAPTIERCDSWAAGAPVWVAVANAVYNVAYDGGIVYLAGIQGNFLSRVRMTSTGGYWWLGLDAQVTLPTGAAAIPDDLKLAWLLQCQALWLVRDNLGVTVAGAGSVSFVTLSLPGYELVPQVREIINGYVRFAISG